jgi:hypothetical protein
MRARRLSMREIVRSLLRSILLVPILFTFGCANKLNLISEGGADGKELSGAVAPIFSMMAAELDYSIVVSVPNGAKTFPIFWTKKGEVTWYPFWVSVTWWRFGLIKEGVENALCYTDWMPVGTESVNVTKFPCDIDVDQYFGVPLVGMLDFRFGGDKKTPPGDGEKTDGVARLFFLNHLSGSTTGTPSAPAKAPN